MMAGLQTVIDKDVDCDLVKVLLDTDMVVGADKYPTYTAAAWKANPKLTKLEHYTKLIEFYAELRAGNFINATDKLEPLGIFVTVPRVTTEIYCSLDALQKDDSILREEAHFENFQLLQFKTPYAFFGMESYHGPWTPEHGRIAVVSHQDISEPLAKLVSATAEIHIPAIELKPELAKFYQF